MIKALLTRSYFNEKRTLGVFGFYDDAKLLPSWCTCEDPVRGKGDAATVDQWKVKGDSAIPYGTYTCALTYSPKYKRNMWEIQNVPGFAGIRIHSGNTEADTEGCVLLGENFDANYNGVLRSRKAIEQFEAFLNERGNPSFELTITK